MIPTTTATTTAEKIAGFPLAIDPTVFISGVVTLIISILGTFISKEGEFDKKAKDLLQKFLDKKVSALRLLFDSVDFVPTSFNEVKEFKGKAYFTEIDKYVNLERKVQFLSLAHRSIMSFFHYAIIFAIITLVGSFLKFPVLSVIFVSISIFLAVVSVFGIFIKRQIENKILKISDMDELKHNE